MAITPPAGRNIVSVSWGDHLMFGEDDGRLATPAALGRRLIRWQTDLNAGTLHWRVLRTRLDTRFFAARGRSYPVERTRASGWDDVAVVPRLAHEAGVRAYLYVAIFDDGWPLPPKRVRAMSYHNRMHGQHVSWQSAFSREHPSLAVVDRHRRRRQWGVLCLAYPEVRSHLRSRWLGLIAPTDFDKTVYPPVFTEQTARLYVARQWDARSRDEEAALLDQPVVAGLVFSSFRFDNPAAVARGDWRA
jgi:hypothetical protein